jgi:hypothetical protein
MDEGSKNGGEDLLNTCWVSPAPTLEPLPHREGPSSFLALKFLSRNFLYETIRDALNHLTKFAISERNRGRNDRFDRLGPDL